MAETNNEKKTEGREMEVFTFSSDLEIPKFEIKKNADWYDWGKKNDFPEKVKSLREGAPAHAALIKRVSQMIKGKGFIETPENASYIKNENGEEDLNRILSKCAFDTRMIGGFFLNVIWTNNMKDIAAVHHIPFTKTRVAAPHIGRHSKDNVDYFYIMPDWSKRESENNQRKLYQGFSRNFRNEKSQIIYCRIDGDYDSPYSMPVWIYGLPYIELSGMLANKLNNGVKNGTSLKTLFVFDDPANSEDERKAMNKKIQEFVGPDGSVASALYDGNGFRVVTIPKESDEHLQWLDRLSVQRTAQAHNVPLAKTFALDSENQKGTTFESSNRNEHEMIGLQNFFIAPIQQEIEYFFKRIFDVDMEIQPVKVSEEIFNDLNQDNILPGHRPPKSEPQLVPEKDNQNTNNQIPES